MTIIATEILDENIVVRYCHGMPHSVEGFVSPSEDGTANIYINANLCPKRRETVLNHELEHIKKNDHYNQNSIYEVEFNNEERKLL